DDDGLGHDHLLAAVVAVGGDVVADVGLAGGRVGRQLAGGQAVMRAALAAAGGGNAGFLHSHGDRSSKYSVVATSSSVPPTPKTGWRVFFRPPARGSRVRPTPNPGWSEPAAPRGSVHPPPAPPGPRRRPRPAPGPPSLPAGRPRRPRRARARSAAVPGPGVRTAAACAGIPAAAARPP